MFKKSLLIGVLCLILIVLVITGGTAMGDTKIIIVLKDDGTTKINLDGLDLHETPINKLPPGRIIPDADLGQIYRFFQAPKKNSRCVKRNCRWY